MGLESATERAAAPKSGKRVNALDENLNLYWDDPHIHSTASWRFVRKLTLSGEYSRLKLVLNHHSGDTKTTHHDSRVIRQDHRMAWSSPIWLEF